MVIKNATTLAIAMVFLAVIETVSAVTQRRSDTR